VVQSQNQERFELYFCHNWWFNCYTEIVLVVQVERLCDRVQSSTLLEDRRDAVRALKSLSKVVGHYRICLWLVTVSDSI